MEQSFAELLTVGGKTNSLGKAPVVVNAVLQDKARLEELYHCMFHDDAWARMRAADSLEKICRVHPEWLAPYIDRILSDFSANSQPSIQWHMAQIFNEVPLLPAQQQKIAAWLKNLLASSNIDWIVATNATITVAAFAKKGLITASDARQAINVQLNHKSNAVIKRAKKLLVELD